MNKIIGVTVGTPVPQSDWNQKNPNRADYIKNKPEVANALKGSVSGNPVSMADVSPLEHELKVTVSKGGATVQKLGKNIFDGKLKKWRDTDRIQNVNPVKVKKNTNYTISVVGATIQPMFGIYTSTDESITTDDVNVASNCCTFNSGNNEEVYFRPWAENWYYGIDFNSKVQVEEGTEITEYEPYVCEEFTADENGNVEGVTSLYPTTTLTADSGVTISAEYNADTKKYIDKKFAELQALILEV